MQKRPTPSMAIVLPQAQLEKFFPANLRSALDSRFPDTTHLDPSRMDTVAWREEIQQINPQILLTGWETPELPGEPPSNLEYICHLTGSMRGVIPRRYLERGIAVTNWGDSISHTIAEMGLFLILHSLRRATATHEAMHHRKGWKEDAPPHRSLFGRRVGIHGFGRIARKLVALLEPFQVRISAHSPPVPDSHFHEYGVRKAESLEKLFSENEIIVELEGLTPETRGMITGKFLSRIPDDGLFVLVGRAGLVEEAALLREARSGRIACAMDVYWEEPLPADSPLRGLPNVALFPHTAGPTPDQLYRCGERALENLDRFLSGRELIDPITPDSYDRIT